MHPQNPGPMMRFIRSEGIVAVEDEGAGELNARRRQAIVFGDNDEEVEKFMTTEEKFKARFEIKWYSGGQPDIRNGIRTPKKHG